MPFDQDETKPSAQSKKIGVKSVSSQKSIFDNMPKKPTQGQLEAKVAQVQETASVYKTEADALARQFINAIKDKTLVENKNQFQKDVEVELLRNMANLAQKIDNDEVEMAGMGSLAWIVLLFRTCFNQRDRANALEYRLLQLEKKMSAVDNAPKKE